MPESATRRLRADRSRQTIRFGGGVNPANATHARQIFSILYVCGLYFSTILSNDFITSNVRAIGIIVIKNNRDKLRR